MGLEVSGDVLQAALAKAVTEAVPEEMRKQIFAEALSKFLFHKVDRHSDETVVSTAFKRALEDATKELAVEVVTTERPRIEAAMRETFAKVLESGALTDAVVSRMQKAVRGW